MGDYIKKVFRWTDASKEIPSWNDFKVECYYKILFFIWLKSPQWKSLRNIIMSFILRCLHVQSFLLQLRVHTFVFIKIVYISLRSGGVRVIIVLNRGWRTGVPGLFLVILLYKWFFKGGGGWTPHTYFGHKTWFGQWGYYQVLSRSLTHFRGLYLLRCWPQELRNSFVSRRPFKVLVLVTSIRKRIRTLKGLFSSHELCHILLF